jgi:hypothetical protein
MLKGFEQGVAEEGRRGVRRKEDRELREGQRERGRILQSYLLTRRKGFVALMC